MKQPSKHEEHQEERDANRKGNNSKKMTHRDRR